MQPVLVVDHWPSHGTAAGGVVAAHSWGMLLELESTLLPRSSQPLLSSFTENKQDK